MEVLPERGDTAEFLIDGTPATGKISSSYVARGGSHRVTVVSGGRKYTRLAAHVTVTRKAPARPAGAPAGPNFQRAGEHSPNSGKRYPAEPLTPAEMAALISHCSRRAPTGIRNRAMLTLFYRSGLRVSELLALKPSSVNAASHSIRLLDTKSGDAQTRHYQATADDALERWIGERKRLGLARNGTPLFCTLKGEPVSPEYLRGLLRRLAAKAGVDKRVHPHGLRHTFAVELEQSGEPVTVISKLLGHKSIAVTARYLDHLTNHDAGVRLQNADLPPLEG